MAQFEFSLGERLTAPAHCGAIDDAHFTAPFDHAARGFL
jgi:hypothetical protein